MATVGSQSCSGLRIRGVRLAAEASGIEVASEPVGVGGGVGQQDVEDVEVGRGGDVFARVRRGRGRSGSSEHATCWSRTCVGAGFRPSLALASRSAVRQAEVRHRREETRGDQVSVSTGEGPSSRLPIGDGGVKTWPIDDFLAADERRPTSFITNFGNWPLPDPVARALESQVAHLEWFHDTGELVAIGGVPHRGTALVEIPAVEGAAEELVDVLAGPFGGAGVAFPTADGAVRQFPEMVVSERTRVAVLAVVRHGPRVHELLWGWHRKHRRAEGWSWLEERLLQARHDGGDEGSPPEPPQ
jgi:hypothetical protein